MHGLERLFQRYFVAPTTRLVLRPYSSAHRLDATRNFRNFAGDGGLADFVEYAREGVRHFLSFVSRVFHSDHARRMFRGLGFEECVKDSDIEKLWKEYVQHLVRIGLDSVYGWLMHFFIFRWSVFALCRADMLHHLGDHLGRYWHELSHARHLFKRREKILICDEACTYLPRCVPLNDSVGHD